MGSPNQRRFQKKKERERMTERKKKNILIDK